MGLQNQISCIWLSIWVSSSPSLSSKHRLFIWRLLMTVNLTFIRFRCLNRLILTTIPPMNRAISRFQMPTWSCCALMLCVQPSEDTTICNYLPKTPPVPQRRFVSSFQVLPRTGLAVLLQCPTPPRSNSFSTRMDPPTMFVRNKVKLECISDFCAVGLQNYRIRLFYRLVA